MSEPAVIAPPQDAGGATAGRAAPLTVAGIVKTWAREGPPVLAGVDLELPPGEAVAISGANGAGKTTLLRIAAGLILPDAGTVTICGLDSERDRTAAQRRIGFLSAGNTGLYGRLKVEHHLEFAARLAFMPRREREAAIARVIEQFELGPFCGRRVDRTSMGQRQRLRLAMAFVHDPELVLLDEPATSLDEAGVTLVQAALDSLRSRGGSALLCVPTGWTQSVAIDRHYLLADGALAEAPR